jgi:hypothetical protein
MRTVQRYLLRKQAYNNKILFSLSTMAIFPTLGLVFNRIKKSGNTSVVTFLHELDGHRISGTPEDVKKQLTHVQRLNLQQH